MLCNLFRIQRYTAEKNREIGLELAINDDGPWQRTTPQYLRVGGTSVRDVADDPDLNEQTEEANDSLLI